MPAVVRRYHSRRPAGSAHAAPSKATRCPAALLRDPPPAPRALPTRARPSSNSSGRARPCPQPGRQRRRRRGVRGRALGLGAQGRGRARRAQPRQVAVGVGLPRPAAGNASTSDYSRAALEQTVRAAYDIARFTAEDPAAGLPDDEGRPGDARACRATSICSTRGRSTRQAGGRDRAALRGGGARHRPADHQFRGAGCRRSSRTSLPATAAAFAAAMQFAPLAVGRPDRVSVAQGRRRHAARRLVQLDAGAAGTSRRRRPSGAIGAAERALSRLKSRKIPTCEVPVLFESTLASGLLGAYVQATSGASLYRKASFLLDSLGQVVLPAHVDIVEDPHVPRARAARRSTTKAWRRGRAQWCPAAWCRATSWPAIRRASSACARPGTPAGRQPALTSRLTAPGDDLDAMLRKLGGACSSSNSWARASTTSPATIRAVRPGSGSKAADRVPGPRGHDRRQPARHAARHRRRRRRRLPTMGTRTLGSVLVERMTVAGA